MLFKATGTAHGFESYQNIIGYLGINNYVMLILIFVYKI